AVRVPGDLAGAAHDGNRRLGRAAGRQVVHDPIAVVVDPIADLHLAGECDSRRVVAIVAGEVGPAALGACALGAGVPVAVEIDGLQATERIRRAVVTNAGVGRDAVRLVQRSALVV